MTTSSLLRGNSPGSLSLAPDALVRLEERIEAEIGCLQRAVKRIARAECQRGGEDLDVTVLRQGHEAEQALRADWAESLADRIGALHRLREQPESFGICDGCRNAIPWERLELLPTARRCTGC